MPFWQVDEKKFFPSPVHIDPQMDGPFVSEASGSW